MAASVHSTYCIHKLWEKYNTVKEGELGMTPETTVLEFVHIFFYICSHSSLSGAVGGDNILIVGTNL